MAIIESFVESTTAPIGLIASVLACLIIALALVGKSADAANPEPVVFHVATNGNDGWSGKMADPDPSNTDGPFATLTRARDAVREMKRGRGLTTPVNVVIRGGTYYLPEPLTLAPEDSGTEECPITFQAYPGETPIISGGRAVGGWYHHRDGIWACSLKDLALNRPIRNLFFLGEPQDLARYPNKDQKNPRLGGWMHTLEPPVQKSFVQWIMRAPDWVEYDIECPKTGDYHLWVRYSGHPGSDAMLTASIDGGSPVDLKNLPTEDYLKFGWSSRIAKIHLTKGQHTVRFTARANHNGFYPDVWVLCEDPQFDPETGSAGPGASVIHFEAEQFSRHGARRGPFPGDDRMTLELGYNPAPPSGLPKDTVLLPVRKTWEAPGAEIVVFTPWLDWLTNVLPIEEVDEESGSLKLGSAPLLDIGPGRRCYVRNILAELDAPGEWHLDEKTATLYFWPPNNRRPGDGEVVMGVLDGLIRSSGDASKERYVSHVHISGLTFSHTSADELGGVECPSDGAVRLADARKFRIADCQFLGVAANAITLEPTTEMVTVEGCLFDGVGSCGVYVPQGRAHTSPGSTLTRHVVVGNEFTRCSQLHTGTGAVEMWAVGGNTIEHNFMHDLPRWAVAMPYTREGHNTIRYNEMRRTCLETGDCGAIHNSGNASEKDNEIAYNLIVDVPGLVTDSRGARASQAYIWAIYLDEAASGYHVHHNVVVGFELGGLDVHKGSNNTFENNIFVGGTKAQTSLRMPIPEAKQIRIVRNIFHYTERDALLHCVHGDNEWTKRGHEIDKNLIFCNGHPVRVAYSGADPNGDSWDGWKALGFDTNSVVADPLFVDLANEDFRLKAESPALKLGFEQIDLSRVGLSGYKE